MNNLKFSLLVSLFCFFPLLGNPFILLLLPILLLYPDSAAPEFLGNFIKFLGLYGLSTIMVYITLQLVEKRNKFSKIMLYIFLIPLLISSYMFIQLIIEFLSKNYVFNEAAFLGGSIALLLMSLSFLYFYFIKEKVRKIKKETIN